MNTSNPFESAQTSANNQDMDRALDIAGNAIMNESLDRDSTIQRLLAEGYTQEQANDVVNAVYEYANESAEGVNNAQPARNDLDYAQKLAANAILNKHMGKPHTIQLLMDQGYSQEQAKKVVDYVSDNSVGLTNANSGSQRTKGIFYIILGAICFLVGVFAFIFTGSIGSGFSALAGLIVMLRGGMAMSQ